MARVTLELGPAELSALIHSGFLAGDHAHDPEAVAVAIGGLLRGSMRPKVGVTAPSPERDPIAIIYGDAVARLRRM